MFIVYIYISICLTQVCANNNSWRTIDEEILRNFSISPFLDENRNIRLNLTWDKSSDKVDLMTIRFLDTDDCNPIDGVDRLPIKKVTNFIVPPLNLINPADYLMNGCEYEVILESNDLEFKISQTVNYKIPDCVEDKCICGNHLNSPYQINSIKLMYDDIYFLEWKKISNVNLTVLDITCIRENSTSFTQIEEKKLKEEGAEILLPDLKENIKYKIMVRFTYDGCFYVTSITMSVPSKRNTTSIVFGLLVSIMSIVAIIFTFTICSRQLRSKLKKYITCWNDNQLEDIYAITPLSPHMLKEQINPQYTSLDFEENAHKYDKYEFPRNKIIIKKEIGKGAFGVVFYGEAFEIGNIKGYTKVAVKQLRVDAADDEKQDLINEMKILKKVGENKNIVKLLGCVTKDQPYMMLLELVPCGSLKSYLMKLRDKWSHRKSRFFFAEDLLQVSNRNKIHRQESENLRYTTVLFENSDASYIQPEKLSLEEDKLQLKNGYVSKYLSLDRIRRISEGPQSPTSLASTDLPSCADTEMTTLSSEQTSPISINDYDDKIETILDNTELQNFALQIARGMEYLEKINVTHRDLAARNILMGNDKVLKISDFGLSRVGTYVSSIGKKLPLRWMAIEAIEEKTCDNKSDVWSFAVVLWEIGTLGAFPYRKTPNTLVLHDLKLGKRLERPRICTDELYTMMLKCWDEKPQNRLTFCEIVEYLDMKQKKIYVDFSVLNPTYDFPPATEDCT